MGTRGGSQVKRCTLRDGRWRTQFTVRGGTERGCLQQFSQIMEGPRVFKQRLDVAARASSPPLPSARDTVGQRRLWEKNKKQDETTQLVPPDTLFRVKKGTHRTGSACCCPNHAKVKSGACCTSVVGCRAGHPLSRYHIIRWTPQPRGGHAGDRLGLLVKGCDSLTDTSVS